MSTRRSKAPFPRPSQPAAKDPGRELHDLLVKHAKVAFAEPPEDPAKPRTEVVFTIDLREKPDGPEFAACLAALSSAGTSRILTSWQGEIRFTIDGRTPTQEHTCRAQVVVYGGLRYLAVSARLSSMEKGEKGKAVEDHLLKDGPAFQNGLLLIAGRTGSGKTHLVSQLILGLLQKHPPSESEKTFLTAEDPFELLAKCESLHPDWVNPITSGPKKLNLGTIGRPTGSLLACIPRDITQDGDLHQVLLDALRQTPYLVFVGELREDDDWRHVMRFAMTGHRIIATTHASSVHECLLRLFKATDAKTSSERAIALQAVHGVIHNHVFETTDPESKKRKKHYLPSCWWATPLSRKQLAGDRLCGLVAASNSALRVGHTLGKSYFVLQSPKQRAIRELVCSAIQHDLLGV